LDGRTGWQGAVSSSSRQSSPSWAKDAAHVAFGQKAATVIAAATESEQDEEEQEDDEEYDSQGSESSASLSPEEEAAQRQQLERDLQELQARLPSQRAASAKVRSIRVSEPVDLLALADQGVGLGRSDGQVDVRPMWRRTMTEPGPATE